MKILAKIGQFIVIFRVSTAVLGVHTGLKMDQGYQILGNVIKNMLSKYPILDLGVVVLYF